MTPLLSTSGTKPHWLPALFLSLMMLCAGLPSRADDIDIYNNPVANTLLPPYTVIVLDLNLLGICNSVVTQTSNPNNPDAPQLCLNISNSIVLSDLLLGVNSNPSALLTSLLNTLTTDQLCAIIRTPGLLGLAPLLGSVCNLVSGPLALTGFLLTTALNALGVTNVLNTLVSGLVNPLLSTVVGQLPVAVIGLLNTTFSGILNLGQVGLIGLLEAMLNNLINTNVAIMVSHADRSTAGGAAASTCSYAELASIPGARRTTAGCSNGAYVLVGFTPLVNTGSVSSLLSIVTNKLTSTLSPANLLNSITAILATTVTTPTQLLPPYQGKEVYAELMQYVGGKAIYNGPLARWDGLTGLLTRDSRTPEVELANGNYAKPALQCRTVNVLNAMLTNNIRDTESDSLLRTQLPGLPSSGAITLANVVQQSTDPGFTDDVGNRISLRSFFLIQDLLTSTATLGTAGATLLPYVNSTGLLGLGQSLAPFLVPTLVVNASLVSAVVANSPVSQSGLLEPAFFGQFKPRDGKSPNWTGNLKRLRLLRSGNGNRFVDSGGVDAIASDGRIKTTTLTDWTSISLLGGAGVDGRETTLGGAGQNIPGYLFGGGGNPGRINADGRRSLFYDSLSASNVPSLAALDADSQTVRDALKTDLGVPGNATADDTQRRALLLHARGFDVGTTASPKNVATNATPTVTGRPWLMGALLHSQPVAINYGARSGFSTANPDVRVLFGTADGYLHSVRNASSSGAASGNEVWAFMPRATMGSIKTLRDDSTNAKFPYGVDGAPTVLLIDRSPTAGPADGIIDSSNTNDHAYAFFGLRRGGGNYYGLDVTNPGIPTLMWRIGTDGLYSATASAPGLVSGSAAQFAELAMTFGRPVVGRIRYRTGTDASSEVTRPILVFSGGYNGGVASNGTSRLGKDLNNSRNSSAAAQVGVDDTHGNALFIVDAVTGELIWKAARSSNSAITAYDSSSRTFRHPLLADSIASDVSLLDTDGDGLSDRLYVGDTGGRVWRADFPGTIRSDWTVGPIASLGRTHPTGSGTPDTTNANDRRFFHAPDFVPQRDTTGAFDAVVIGSGDREDPFNRNTSNWLYTIRDRDTVSGKSTTDTTTVNGLIISDSDSRLFTQSGLTDISTSCAAVSGGTCTTNAAGWRLALPNSGEKAVSAPVTIGNTVTFSSFVPPPVAATSCVPNEGTSRVYGISLANGRPVVTQFINDADGATRSALTAAPGIAGEVLALTPQLLSVNAETLSTTVPLIYRTFWRERREDEEKAVPQ